MPVRSGEIEEQKATALEVEVRPTCVECQAIQPSGLLVGKGTRRLGSGPPCPVHGVRPFSRRGTTAQ